MLKDTPDKWISGEAYEQFMGRWSRRLAKEFVDWLNPPASWNWLEVGCGTGALTQAICLNADPAAVTACDPSAQFVDYARRSFTHPAVTFLVAGAGELPHHEDGFDAAVSGLVLELHPVSSRSRSSDEQQAAPGWDARCLCVGLRGGHAVPADLLGGGGGAGHWRSRAG